MNCSRFESVKSRRVCFFCGSAMDGKLDGAGEIKKGLLVSSCAIPH